MPLLPKLVQSHCVFGFDGTSIIPCIVSSFDVVIDCSEAEKKGLLRTINLKTGEKREINCEFLRNRQCHAVICEQSPLGVFLIFLLCYIDEQNHRKRFVFVCGQLMASDGNLTVVQVGNEHPCVNSPEEVRWFSFQRDIDGTLYLVIQWYGSKKRPQSANDPNNSSQNNTMFHLIHLKLRSFSGEEIKSQGLIESSVILAFGQDVPGKCKRAYILNREIRFPRIGSDQEVRIAVTGCDKPGIMSEYGTETGRGKSNEPLRCGNFLITYDFDKEQQTGIIWADNLCLQQRTPIVRLDKHIICHEGHQLVAHDNDAIYLLGKCAEGCNHIYGFYCSKPGRLAAVQINPTASQMVALTAIERKSLSSQNSQSNKVRIIHGPPSSGKSTVFWLMLLQVINEGKKVLLYLSKADDKAEYEALFQTRDVKVFIELIDENFMLENIATEGILFINRIPQLTYKQKNSLLIREETSVVVIDDDIPTPLQQPRKGIDWMHLSAVVGNEQQKSSAIEIRESLLEKCNRRWIKMYGRDDDSSNETKLIRFTENSQCLSDGKRRGNDAELKFAKAFLKLNLGGYLFWGFDTQQFLIKIRKMKVLGRFYEELSDASRSHFEADFIFIHWHFGIHLIEVKAASEYKSKSPMKQFAIAEEDETERKAKRLKFEVENTTQTSAVVSANAFPLNKAHTKAVFQLGKQNVVLNKISETFLGTEFSDLHLHICCPNTVFLEEMKDENCSYIDKMILNDENRLNEYWSKWNLSISDKNIAAEWQEKLKKFVVILGAYDFDVLRKSAEKLDLEFSDNQNVSDARYRHQYYGNALLAATATQTKSDIFSDHQSRISTIQICPKNNNTNYRVTEILREGNPEVKTRIFVMTDNADSATNDDSNSGIYRPKNNLNHGKELIVQKENLAEIEEKVRELWKPYSIIVIAESEDVADDVRSYLANKAIPCGTIKECGDFVIVDVEKPDLEKSFWDIVIYLKSE